MSTRPALSSQSIDLHYVIARLMSMALYYGALLEQVGDLLTCGHTSNVTQETQVSKWDRGVVVVADA